MKFFGTVNHRPKFFAPNFAQNSAPRKTVFSHTVSRQISRPFWHSQPVFLSARSAPFKPKKQELPSGSDFWEHPFLLLSLHAITWRPAAITCVIKMKDKGREQCSQNRIFFATKFRGCASAVGAALTICILESEIVLGVLYRKGGPQKGWYFSFSPFGPEVALEIENCSCHQPGMFLKFRQEKRARTQTFE